MNFNSSGLCFFCSGRILPISSPACLFILLLYSAQIHYSDFDNDERKIQSILQSHPALADFQVIFPNSVPISG